MPARKLIEVALPLDAINAASAREKSIRHGHPSTLHLWWARRPLATARAVIFASLVDDPHDDDANPDFVAACESLMYSADKHDADAKYGNNVADKGNTPRMRLFDFIEKLVQWESTTDEQVMSEARRLIRLCTDGKPPPLLDPFAGGGSIPLEAQRLGLEAHASDLNPVAVMINKAMIEIPPRFAGIPPVNPDARDITSPRLDGGTEGGKKRRGTEGGQSGGWRGAAGLAADVRYYGEWMRARAEEKIGHLYPRRNGETVIAWLWARTVISPNPAVNAPVPLVSSFALSKKKGRKFWAKPIVEGNAVRFEVAKGSPPKDNDGTMIRRQGARCIVSGEPIPFEYIRSEGKAGRLGSQLMAIVTDGKHGRSYYSPDDEHARIAESAAPKWKPVGRLPDKHRSISSQVYGLDEFHKLFTARQLTALTTFCDLVKDVRSLVTDHALNAGLADDGKPLQDGGHGALAYSEAVSVYLSFAVDKISTRNAALTLWDVSKSSIGHVFARQAIPMIWSYAEVNPVNGAMGSWSSAIDGLRRAVESFTPLSCGVAKLEDALTLSPRVTTLSTDPPYYDNVGYADLSDFFYVWMRRSLGEVYPQVFSTLLAPKSAELIASAQRHGSKSKSNIHFEGGMRNTFRNIRRFVRPDYPLTVYYAFKQQDAQVIREGGKVVKASTGWETMLTSLIDAGFQIVGTWPVRSEGKTRMNAQGTNALASSIVLVCRTRPPDAPTLSRARFQDRLRRELPEKLETLFSGQVSAVDQSQAAIGPGMAIYSQYSAVRSADGSALSVREALGMINGFLVDTLSEIDARLDAETQFALKWFEHYGWGEGDYGDAEVMVTALNTSVAGVAEAGLIKLGGGKAQLKHFSKYGEYEPSQDKRRTAWEAAHHLAKLAMEGEGDAAELVNLLYEVDGELVDAVGPMTRRLYEICERKNRAQAGFVYNSLDKAWRRILDQAAELRANTQGSLELE